MICPSTTSTIGDVIVDDSVLPAATHLMGPRARDVLAPAVAAGGSELLACEPVHVQYRPGSDLVVRFRARVRRGGRDVTDTLVAGTTASGPPAGTLAVEADEDGTALTVGVWRWPFDPVLTSLGIAVTPTRVAHVLGHLVGDRPALDVVAYRPMERAVVRVRPERGDELYLKVVDPDATGSLVRRHELLLDAGLPVPPVVASGDGWIALGAIQGPTLRHRLKAGDDRLPGARDFLELYDLLARVDATGLPSRRARALDAPGHAAMLARVLPDQRERLDRIVDALSPAIDRSTRRSGTTVHGDLHEGQLVLSDDRIVGVLDIDDVGPGDPLDDVATVLAHLRFRALTSARPDIDTYADRLRAAIAARDGDVDVVTAAVLVGLATGPFRIQQDDWRTTTATLIDTVELLLEPGRGRRPR